MYYVWLPLPPISSHVIICHAWANYLSGIMYTAGMAVSVCHGSEVCTGRFCLCLLGTLLSQGVASLIFLSSARYSWGREAEKIWAEIWNLTHESWSWFSDFCRKLLCLGYSLPKNEKKFLTTVFTSVGWETSKISGMFQHSYQLLIWHPYTVCSIFILCFRWPLPAL